MIRRLIWSICSLVLVIGSLQAQPDRWQQRVEYEMEIDFDVQKHQFSGKQRLVYYNNSPDDLDRVFYHLYFNAFQPGSMMDVRSRTIADPSPKIGSRIEALSPDEQGYHRIKRLTCNGRETSFETVGTILEVALPEPIPAGATAILEMEFESQVPVQIRRSGRDNKEGIAYSMAQWYPKLCEYDYQGWHANPYIAREFYGVWGDFDVRIRIDRDFVLAGTGYLQNASQVGYGYEAEGEKVDRPRGKKLEWHFLAPQVHDFVWAADPDYQHLKLTREDGTVLHAFYQESERNAAAWKALLPIMDRAFELANARFGQYPYRQYSFIQGGDGGMEYPMATLITGERGLSSLVGVSVHELMHSWYQMVLGTNESLYAWMDEGFATYAEEEVLLELKSEGLIPGSLPTENSYDAYYANYADLVFSRLEEPLTTPADHFTTNYAYGRGSYDKGAVFLQQLEYVIGRQAFAKGMLRYFELWKFKHPNPNDFIRVMEKVSGLELDWYKEYWIQTTHFVEYAIDEVSATSKGRTKIKLERVGRMPMPIDLLVTYKDGSRQLLNIPLRIMRGSKPAEESSLPFLVLEDWPWTNPTYELELQADLNDIEQIEIDPTRRLADLNRQNNIYQIN